jgi:predicted amidohydrolase YtcJ
MSVSPRVLEVVEAVVTPLNASRRRRLLQGTALICCLLGSHPVAQAADADLILHSGKVVTADERFAIHEAIAVENRRISQLGKTTEVLQRRGPRTEIVDVQGKLVLPGLMDSHVHAADACLTEFDHSIPPMERIQDVLDYIQSRARVIKEGEWIEVRQVFITRLQEQRYPTRAELDRAAPKHPLLFATGPDASLNTLALKLSGIGRDFKVRDGGTGFAEKDPKTGEPTGILRNCTRYVKVKSAKRQPTRAEKVQRLRELLTDYNGVGLTSVCDRDASPDEIETYKELRAGGGLTVRVSLSQHIDSIGSFDDVLTSIRRVSQDPLFTQRDEWLRIIGIKTYLDGGMLTGSAYMRQPWGVSEIYGISDPAYRGVLFIPKERLVPMVHAAVESGLQFTAHSVGDGAVHALLEAYAEVDKELPVRKTHPCISHSNFLSHEAVEQAARLGVMMDIQPAWLYLDTRTLARQFGYERLRYFQPLRSLFEAGAVAGGGSDHMQKIGSLRSINPYNPFLGIATTITRRARQYAERLHPEEALTREQAIRFYTINNARVLDCDDKLGSLEPGKLADLIVLDTDLLTCPEDQIAGTQVLRTYVGGKLVYRRENQR